MSMSRKARSAFEELKSLGVSVFEWEETGNPSLDRVAEFTFAWANGDRSEVFADRSGTHIKEEFVDGRFVNPMGYRQDVHEILKRHDLVTDWLDAGTVVVMAGDAAGYLHGSADIEH